MKKILILCLFTALLFTVFNEKAFAIGPLQLAAGFSRLEPDAGDESDMGYKLQVGLDLKILNPYLEYSHHEWDTAGDPKIDATVLGIKYTILSSKLPHILLEVGKYEQETGAAKTDGNGYGYGIGWKFQNFLLEWKKIEVDDLGAGASKLKADIMSFSFSF